jgi:hypothetical protein
MSSSPPVRDWLSFTRRSIAGTFRSRGKPLILPAG